MRILAAVATLACTLLLILLSGILTVVGAVETLLTVIWRRRHTASRRNSGKPFVLS